MSIRVNSPAPGSNSVPVLRVRQPAKETVSADIVLP